MVYMPSSLREMETNALDAKTYLEKVNTLNLGAYSLLDGSTFPECIMVVKTSCVVKPDSKDYWQVETCKDGSRQLDLPELEILKGMVFCKMCDELLNQLKPHLAKDEADIYVQHVKKI